MNELKKLVVDEIRDIEHSGLSTKNLGTLGALVDIYKDLVNVEYWCYKMELGNSSSLWGSSLASQVSERTGELVAVNSKLKSTDSPNLSKEYNIILDDLLSSADTIRVALKNIPLVGEYKSKYETIFK